MMRKITYYLLFTYCFLMFSSCRKMPSELSLAGEWHFALDSTDCGVKDKWYTHSFQDKIKLPGTTDDAGYGIPNSLSPALQKPQVLHLTRKNSYIGPAWYSKEVDIPAGWEKKSIGLSLERVIWNTSVWVDGQEVTGSQESLVAPHQFDLTGYLTPGKHKITIRVDNRKQHEISDSDMGHAYTNQTQIIWNGILGDITLTAKDAISITDLQVYPDQQKKQLKVTCLIDYTGEESAGKVIINLRKEGKKLQTTQEKEITLRPGKNPIEMLCSVTDPIQTWNEFTPHLYTLELTAEDASCTDKQQTTFGFRDLKRQDAALLLNDRKIFLRGTLECCIFPLTGYPPMEHEGWKKVFDSAREWGLNHLRFHSWCPPKAAFEVADSIGFYLQVELPLWSLQVGKDEATNSFLYREADRILAEYGNHPSFCFFSLGNELQPDFDFLSGLLTAVKQKDPRHLYTTTSFTFERGHGSWPEANDDFFITQWTKQGWVRGQGVFNTDVPCFDKDYSASVTGMEVPLVTHEIGQYAVYPDLKEIEKYTGVLDPLNFKAVKEDLAKKGLSDKAEDYLMASGKLAAILYKEEIERAMKTPGISGIQLLDLHDFPGQGTALVGLLNAFWESKGITDAAAFRTFCAPVVPLARFKKAVYTNDETFEAQIEVVNYGVHPLDNQSVSWTLTEKDGKVIKEGEFSGKTLAIGNNTPVGTINYQLAEISNAKELQLTTLIKGTEYRNEWKIWVYPASLPIEEGDIIVTDRFAVAETALKQGKNVLFNPPYESLEGLEGKFVPVFWSPVHFPKQAGTMGLLLDPAHPAFAHFPTAGHTDWQWWRLTTQSRVMNLDSLYRETTPLIECVDNFANNRRLAILFETSCEGGKLIVSSTDLLRDQEKNPEKRQLLYSILSYMKSNAFQPARSIPFEKIRNLATASQNRHSMSVLSYQN